MSKYCGGSLTRTESNELDDQTVEGVDQMVNALHREVPEDPLGGATFFSWYIYFFEAHLL